MSLGIRIGQIRRQTAVPQGTTSPIYGITPDAQGMRPSALQVGVVRNAGTSAHSVTVEGAMDYAGPWTVLATIIDEIPVKISASIPNYIRTNAGTMTGGTADIIITGAVN